MYNRSTGPEMASAGSISGLLSLWSDLMGKKRWARRRRQGLTVLAIAPSCCVPSRNQMMVAAGLALKARQVRLCGVPACSRITGPPSILVSSGGTARESRAESAQGAANITLVPKLCAHRVIPSFVLFSRVMLPNLQ